MFLSNPASPECLTAVDALVGDGNGVGNRAKRVAPLGGEALMSQQRSARCIAGTTLCPIDGPFAHQGAVDREALGGSIKQSTSGRLAEVV